MIRLKTEYLWTEDGELFTGLTNFGIKDGPRPDTADLYVRADRYFDGKYRGPVHLEENSDGRVNWVSHPEGGEMKPISRWAFTAWLDQYPIPLKHT